MEIEEFAAVLSKLREDKDLTQQQLADQAGLSRAYISLLEARKKSSAEAKKPSLDALRSFCQVLCTAGKQRHPKLPIDPSTAIRLVQSALELQLSGPLDEDVGDLSHLKELVGGASEHVWVFTDKLGENVSNDVLDLTTESMKRRGLQYVYFVNNPTEWDKCSDRLLSQKGVGQSLLSRNVTAVLCSSPLCSLRIALFDPGTSTAKGTISIGPVTSVRFKYLQNDQVLEIYSTASQALRHLREKSSRTDRAFGRLTMLFPEPEE